MERTVLVTGGTGGLGSAVTTALLADGWRVVVPYVAAAELARLPENDLLTTVEADLFDPDAVTACVAAASGHGAAPLRAVVNLVGGFAMGGRLHETPIEEFERLLRLNLRPAYLICQAALPVLIDNGGGSIVCVSAQSALRPFSGASGYLTSKTAVLGLAAALHAEYASQHVRVNTILPGVIDTPANRAQMPHADRTGWTPPAQIAETIRFLCSEASAAIRGAQIPV